MLDFSLTIIMISNYTTNCLKKILVKSIRHNGEHLLLLY